MSTEFNAPSHNASQKLIGFGILVIGCLCFLLTFNTVFAGDKPTPRVQPEGSPSAITKRAPRSIQPFGQTKIVRHEWSRPGGFGKFNIRRTAEDTTGGEPSIELHLDWTTMDVELAPYEPFDLILSGTLNTDTDVIWEFTDGLQPEILPQVLHFIEGRLGELEGEDIPCDLTYRINEGDWQLFDINNLTLQIPLSAGSYDIDIRFYNSLTYPPKAGTYKIVLNNTLVPSM